MSRRFIYFILLIYSLNQFILGAATSFASDFHSPRTAALGGAGHANPLLNDAIILNPSFAAFLKNTVSAGINYQSFYGPPVNQVAGEPYGRTYQVSMQDGRTELFQAGLAYSVREQNSILSFGAAKAAIQRLGFGLGTKMIFTPTNQSMGFDANLSTTFLIMPELYASLILDNVIESETSRSLGMYRELILGTKYNLFGILILYADPHFTSGAPEKKWGFEAGTELVLLKDLFLRAGLYRNSTIPYLAQRGQGWGLGLGWIAPRISLDYSFSRVLEPVVASAHSFGFTVYF